MTGRDRTGGGDREGKNGSERQQINWTGIRVIQEVWVKCRRRRKQLGKSKKGFFHLVVMFVLWRVFPFAAACNPPRPHQKDSEEISIFPQYNTICLQCQGEK